MRSTVVFLLVFASVAFAQGDRGTITGTVADPAGAVVASAQVEGKNLETGAIYPTTTTTAGIYTLSQLPVGTYEISVVVPGFKRFVRQGLRVEVAQTLRADNVLEVGAASESVTVTGEASLLKLDSSDVSHNVTVQTLNELPMLGVGSAQAGSSGARNPNNVIMLVPGTYYRANTDVKVNGAPSNTQSFVVEGLDAANQLLPMTPAQVQPSVDAIQEVSIQTSNYAAEYAGGGGYFNITMRSGTNQYHGSVYDYAVNEVLNAGVPFPLPGEVARQRQRRHDYGWTIGGPASIPKLYNGHDRTFFFFNFEQYRETQIIGNIAQTVPIDAYRAGDFSGAMTAVGNRPLTDPFNTLSLFQNEIFDPKTSHTAANGLVAYDPFPNNYIDPARFDPVARKVQELIPHPNRPGFVNNYLPKYPSVRHTTIPAIKGDEQIGSNGHLSFYWSFTHTDSQYSPIYGNSDGLPDKITEARGTFIHSTVYRLNYDHTLSPTLLWHFSAGYQDNNFLDAAPILNFNAYQELGLKGATINRNTPTFRGFCPVVPTAGAAQCTTSAAGGMLNMGPALSGQINQWLQKPAANTSLTWVNGGHTYRFGAGLALQGLPAVQYENTNGNYLFSTRQTAPPYLNDNLMLGAGSVGFGYASFLLGLVDQVSIAPASETRQGKKRIDLFFQDSWKVNRKLTLDYGLRWDYSTYPREQYGRGADFSPTTPNPNAGGITGGWIFEGDGPGHCHCSFAKLYPYAFGPRLGIAYQITPKTVLRAGWGIIYGDTTNTGVSGAASTTLTSPGLAKEAMRLQDGIPITPAWPVFSPGLFPSIPGTVALSLPTGSGGALIGMLDQNAGRPPRQNQWSVGIQREIARNLVVEASYVANRGVWWQSAPRFGAPGGSLSEGNINALTPARLKAVGLDINNPADVALLTQPLSSPNVAGRGFKPPYTGFPTSQSLAQSLRPFPQFGNIVQIRPPVGNTWYDSLQTKATKRYSHGLQFTGLFTWQKSLQEGVESANDVYNDVFVRGVSKWISSFDQPLVFTAVASYNVPKLPGNKWLSYTLADWQIGALLTYASGRPIPAPVASAAPLLSSVLFQPTLANRVAGVPLFVDSNTGAPLDINCHCYDPNKTFVLNPKAWQNPAPGQFGTAAGYYSDYRYQRHPQESMNFGRTFRFKERYSLNLRVEFTNIFNRAYYNDPSANSFTTPQLKNPVTGLNSSGFGYLNTSLTSIQFGQPRQGTLIARFQF